MQAGSKDKDAVHDKSVHVCRNSGASEVLKVKLRVRRPFSLAAMHPMLPCVATFPPSAMSARPAPLNRRVLRVGVRNRTLGRGVASWGGGGGGISNASGATSVAGTRGMERCSGGFDEYLAWKKMLDISASGRCDPTHSEGGKFAAPILSVLAEVQGLRQWVVDTLLVTGRRMNRRCGHSPD